MDTSEDQKLVKRWHFDFWAIQLFITQQTLLNNKKNISIPGPATPKLQ